MLLPSNSFGYRPIYHSSRVEIIVIYLQNENARFEKGKEGRKKERKNREDNDLYARCFSLFAFKRETVTKKTKYVRTITVQHGGIHLSSRKQLIPCTKHSYS